MGPVCRSATHFPPDEAGQLWARCVGWPGILCQMTPIVLLSAMGQVGRLGRRSLQNDPGHLSIGQVTRVAKHSLPEAQVMMLSALGQVGRLLLSAMLLSQVCGMLL